MHSSHTNTQHSSCARMAREGSDEERRLLYDNTPSSSSQFSRNVSSGFTALNTKIMTAGLGIILVGLTALAVLQSDASSMEVTLYTVHMCILIFFNSTMFLTSRLFFIRRSWEYWAHMTL